MTSEHVFSPLICHQPIPLRDADSPRMFNASKTFSHLTQGWRLDTYREMLTLGKAPFFV